MLAERIEHVGTPADLRWDRRRRLDPERVQHVAGGQQGRRSEAEEGVRSLRQRARDLARDREHLPPLFEREVGGDQRAAALPSLHHDCHLAQAGDDPVPGGKPPRCRLDPWCVLRHGETRASHLSPELRMRGRVVAIDTATQHRDCTTARLERTTVRLGVHASRETADDHQPGSRQVTAQRAGDSATVRRARARTDDRNTTTAEELDLRVAADVETGWRIVDRAQEGGESSGRNVRGSSRPARPGASRSARSSNPSRKAAKRLFRGRSTTCVPVDAA